MWVVFTFLAVLSQLGRNIYQKKLGNTLPPLGVSFCRFFFSIPFAIIFFYASVLYFGEIQIISFEFYIFIFLAAISQLIANFLLVSLFKKKNFALSVAFSKSEMIFIAIFGVIFLSEYISFIDYIGIFIAFSGLLYSSFSNNKISIQDFIKGVFHRTNFQGFLSGALFALAAIGIKGSMSFIASESVFPSASFLLLTTLVIQSTVLFGFILYFEKNQFTKIFNNSFVGLQTGFLNSLGSFSWFIAFSLAFLIHVKMIAQIEFLLLPLVSYFYFKEKISRSELIGIFLMMIGSLLLLFE